jgi:hypothetical protein
MTEHHTTTASPSPENVQPQAAEPKANHDARGKFTRGNKGGPGNPFARQTAALRQALISAVTPQDIADIAAQLLEKAKQGDVPAAKLVFSYALGKPTPAVDPDTLDQQEMKTVANNHVAVEDFQRVVKLLPVELVLSLLDAVLPFLNKAKATKFQDMWTAKDAQVDKERAEAEAEAAAEDEDEKEDETPRRSQSVEEFIRESRARTEALNAQLNASRARAGSSKRPHRRAAEPVVGGSRPSRNGFNGAMKEPKGTSDGY